MTQSICNIVALWVFFMLVVCGDGGLGQFGLSLNDGNGEPTSSWTENPSSNTETPSRSGDSLPSNHESSGSSGETSGGSNGSSEGSATALCKAVCNKLSDLACTPVSESECLSACAEEYPELISQMGGERCLSEITAVFRDCTFYCDIEGEFALDPDSCPNQLTALYECAGGDFDFDDDVGNDTTEPSCKPPSCMGCEDVCSTCLCSTGDSEICAEYCE